MKLEKIKVGRIVNAHGIRGELRVQPRDADPNFITRFKTFEVDGKLVTPTENHVHKSVVLMKFPGVDDMDAALALKNKDIFVRRADAHLPQGQYFDEELLGLQVYNVETGALLGELTRVDPYPAHKVYTVQGEKEYLIPAVPEVFIRSVSLDENLMDVVVLEGMASDED